MRVALVCSLAFVLAACSPPSAKNGEAPETSQADRPDIEAAPARTPQESLAAMPSWETARAAGVDFRGVGQEPGWLLDIYTRGIVKFAWDYGDSYAEFAVVEPTHPQEGVTRYQASSDGRELVVTIHTAPCQDAMSGQPYPSQVEVTIDGRALNGCGRNP
jgi:putative lipoprotein